MDSTVSDGGKPFTTPWKIAVVIAVLGVLGDSGLQQLASREEGRHRNQERRINELERKVRELQSALRRQK